MKKLENTESICPNCFKEGKLQKINANIIEDDERILLIKECQKHGFFKEIIFKDLELYKRWIKYKVIGQAHSDIKTNSFPETELYSDYFSHSVLTNLMVTNRYDIITNQNFFDADKTGCVYEPSLHQLKSMMQQTRAQKPLGSKAIQITGGEPTLRDDLLEIIHIAKEVGFSHIQIHTNGLKLAENIEYCKSLKNEKVDTIYLNFNGVTKIANPLIEAHKKVIDNCKKINLNIVIVPNLINETTLLEAGKIVRFAIDNAEAIKGVHFQLFSFHNRAFKMTENEQKKPRIYYEDVFQSIETEYPYQISRNDFYPYCFIFPISKFIEIITKEPQTELTIHPCCGGSTFIFIVDGKPLPITRFINVEAFMGFLKDQSKKKGPLRKLRIASAFMKFIDTFVDYKKAPNGFNPKQILKDATVFGSEFAVREFRNKSLFIGLMEFQDIWNLDIDRLKRCIIQYSTCDGIVPFCSFHSLGYGDKILKKYSISTQEWEKKTGRSLKDDIKKHV